MIVEPCPHGLEELVGISTLPRNTNVVHISDIYGDLYRRLEPGRYGEGPPNPLLLEAGLSFEQELEVNLLAAGLKKRLTVVRPGELISPEGIHMSPDLILANGSVKVGEIKLTWMSCREMPLQRTNSLPEKFSKWAVQIKSYCHLLETPYARLIGYFVNGDYKPPQPKLLAWDLTFTAQELKDNWMLMLRHGKEMGIL